MVTVTGILLDETSAPYHARIHFAYQSGPMIFSGSGIVLPTLTATVKSSPSDGTFSIALEPGLYLVTIDSKPTSTRFTILVPQASATMTIDQLVYTGANVLLPFAPINATPGQAGHGNPNGSLIGVAGQTYLDVDTNNFWVNNSGGTGWAQMTGNTTGAAFTALVAGSGGAPNVTFTGNPNGTVVGTPGQCGIETATNSFWIKASGTGNTGWVEIVGNI